MYDEQNKYPEPTCGGGSPLGEIQSLVDYAAKDESTCRRQLERKKSNLTRQLGEVNEAIAALDANPEIERVLTLVGRTVRF